MREFRGIAASPGIAIHHAFAYYADTISVPHYDIDKNDVEKEWSRFLKAVERAAAEIRTIKDTLSPGHTDQHQLLVAQLLMLRDPDMGDRLYRTLKRDRLNIEWILSEYIENMVKTLEDTGDEYLAERSMDITDISRRITNQLLYRERLSLSGIRKEIVLISPNLLPS